MEMVIGAALIFGAIIAVGGLGKKTAPKGQQTLDFSTKGSTATAKQPGLGGPAPGPTGEAGMVVDAAGGLVGPVAAIIAAAAGAAKTGTGSLDSGGGVSVGQATSTTATSSSDGSVGNTYSRSDGSLYSDEEVLV
jgi:hypothetical protein